MKKRNSKKFIFFALIISMLFNSLFMIPTNATDDDNRIKFILEPIQIKTNSSTIVYDPVDYFDFFLTENGNIEMEISPNVPTDILDLWNDIVNDPLSFLEQRYEFDLLSFKTSNTERNAEIILNNIYPNPVVIVDETPLNSNKINSSINAARTFYSGTLDTELPIDTTHGTNSYYSVPSNYTTSMSATWSTYSSVSYGVKYSTTSTVILEHLGYWGSGSKTIHWGAFAGSIQIVIRNVGGPFDISSITADWTLSY